MSLDESLAARLWQTALRLEFSGYFKVGYRMNDIWNAVQWACLLLIPALVVTWWREHDRLKQIARYIRYAALTCFVVASASNMLFTLGASSQWKRDYVTVSAIQKTEGKIVELWLNDEPLVPGKIQGLLLVILVMATFIELVSPPGKDRREKNAKDKLNEGEENEA